MPSMPGRPRSRIDDVGVVACGEVERLLAGRGEVDLVAARRRFDRQRPADLRLVVDDQDAWSSRAASAGSITTIVSPPPGVSSSSSSPPIASTKPGRPPARGRRRRRGAVAEPLERLEHRLALVAGTPGPAVDDAESTPPSTAPASTRDRLAGRRVAQRRCRRGWRAPARAGGVGDDTRAASRARRAATARRAAPRLASAAGDDLVDADRGAARARRAPACSRLMSSRLPTSASSRSVSSSIVARNSCRSAGDQSMSSLAGGS